MRSFFRPPIRAVANNSSRRYLSAGSSGSSNGPSDVNASLEGLLKESYVHPLSQIVLEHLQTKQSEWVEKTGLHYGGFDLKKDGSFVLKFPRENGKLWTSYDVEERKHYLNIHKGELVGRYIMQDNTKPPWHLSRESVPEKVRNAVDEMIEKLSDTPR
mmetsp:Transcript_8212/g.12212  ORF Transcript_8212/g.12212 Transcript_8212/m.12212 type:complete len:158 (+) Transcript_8212:68-541(+)